MNPIHIFIQGAFNIILPSTPTSSKWSLSFKFPYHIPLWTPHFFSVRAWIDHYSLICEGDIIPYNSVKGIRELSKLFSFILFILLFVLSFFRYSYTSALE
jgi:hypothetical protein